MKREMNYPVLYRENRDFIKGKKNTLHNKEEILDNLSGQFYYFDLSSSQKLLALLLGILIGLWAAFLGTLPLRMYSTPYTLDIIFEIFTNVLFIAIIPNIFVVKFIYGIIFTNKNKLENIYESLINRGNISYTSNFYTTSSGNFHQSIVYEFTTHKGEKATGSYTIELSKTYPKKEICILYLSKNINVLI